METNYDQNALFIIKCIGLSITQPNAQFKQMHVYKIKCEKFGF